MEKKKKVTGKKRKTRSRLRIEEREFPKREAEEEVSTPRKTK